MGGWGLDDLGLDNELTGAGEEPDNFWEDFGQMPTQVSSLAEQQEAEAARKVEIQQKRPRKRSLRHLQQRNPVLRTCSRKRRMIFGQSSTCDIRPPAQIAGCGCCCVHTARSSLVRPSFVAWCLLGCASARRSTLITKPPTT